MNPIHIECNIRGVNLLIKNPTAKIIYNGKNWQVYEVNNKSRKLPSFIEKIIHTIKHKFSKSYASAYSSSKTQMDASRESWNAMCNKTSATINLLKAHFEGQKHKDKTTLKEEIKTINTSIQELTNQFNKQVSQDSEKAKLSEYTQANKKLSTDIKTFNAELDQLKKIKPRSPKTQARINALEKKIKEFTASLNVRSSNQSDKKTTVDRSHKTLLTDFNKTKSSFEDQIKVKQSQIDTLNKEIKAEKSGINDVKTAVMKSYESFNPKASKLNKDNYEERVYFINKITYLQAMNIPQETWNMTTLTAKNFDVATALKINANNPLFNFKIIKI